MNPIEAFLHNLFEIIQRMPKEAQGGMVLLALGFCAMIFVMFRKNLLGGQELREMKVWGKMSAVLNDRIGQLTPHYAASMTLLAKHYAKALQANKDVLNSIKSIKPLVKEKAEMDYCLSDVDEEASIALLTEKLEALLQKKKLV